MNSRFLCRKGRNLRLRKVVGLHFIVTVRRRLTDEGPIVGRRAQCLVGAHCVSCVPPVHTSRPRQMASIDSCNACLPSTASVHGRPGDWLAVHARDRRACVIDVLQVASRYTGTGPGRASATCPQKRPHPIGEVAAQVGRCRTVRWWSDGGSNPGPSHCEHDGVRCYHLLSEHAGK